MVTSPHDIVFRYEVLPTDREAVRRLCAATQFFRDDEVDVAVELVDDCLTQGAAAGYHFVFAEHQGSTFGYACYGSIACTLGSYDLYWIVVDPGAQGRGIGRMLLAEAERLARAAGGRMMYIETSNREQYASTRTFYTRTGYREAAVLDDFYDVGDGKVIYAKSLRAE